MKTPVRTSARAERPKRPVSVTLVAVLAVGVAAYSMTYGALALEAGDDDRLLDGILHLALGVGAFVVGLGALRLQSWAWALFMTWAVIGLTHQVLRYLFFSDPNYSDMAINAFAVLALSPIDVQVAFGLRHTRNVEFTKPTRNPVDRD